MNRQKTVRALLATLLIGISGLATVSVRAQETGEEQWGKWWYGVYGGANYNLFSGTLPAGINTDLTVTNYEKGSGLGLALGGLLEYNPGTLLGFNLRVGYDNRYVKFDQVTTTTVDTSDAAVTATHDLNASLSYLTIEPSLRLNLGDRFLHLLIGPTFGINIGKGSEMTTTTPGATTTVNSDVDNVRSFVIGAQGGIGYDIPLAGPDANTQILLTPFAEFRLGFQNLLDPPSGVTGDFKVNTIRAGVALKFGSRPATAAPLPEEEVVGEFSVRAPSVIAGNRKLNETFPMRDYIFFDAGSVNIPARYKKLSSGDAANFREEQLVKPTVETGGQDALVTRSRRQMEVYYNVMNVFGDRLRRNPSATIKLIGSANGDADAGKKMAENVRNYLVSTFGIDGGRIGVEGRAMPVHKAGSGSSQGEDKKLIDAENYRVEIVADPADLMKPVFITSVQEEPIDNDIVLTIPSDDKIAMWSVDIAERGGTPQTYGPYRNTSTARIDSKLLLGSKREARYTAEVTLTTKDGNKTKLPAREFRLVRADEDEEQTGTRYSVLFEFDDSKTVQTYQDFLINTVAPAIPNHASVIIHGHTDIIGDPEYNAKLSQRRSDETQRVLTQELKKAGKTVTFDTYGFGEDERRAAFNNNLPEQRYYNRTVIIEIVPER